MRRPFLSLALLAALAGCGGGDPTIDGSSEQAFAASVERVKESIGDEKRQIQFESALLALSLDQLGSEIETAKAGGETMGEAARNEAHRKSLHGLTAEQVIEKAGPSIERIMNMAPPAAPGAPPAPAAAPPAP